jgi:lipopolysaccharide/colanic/teichoic acid biosynthesis glycosyltransferase
MYGRHTKRFFDVAVSLLLVGILSPLFLVITVLVFFDLKKQVLFIQERIGLGEKPFYLMKFRTMKDPQETEGSLVSDEDRTTWLGKRLRQTRMDELPQLFHILKGDMSLVGPRPLLPEYLPMYPADIKKRRHTVKPGLTGLAQIKGGNSLAWEARFALDLYYIQHLSFSMDMGILIRTFYFLIFSKKGENIGPYSPHH